MEKIEAIPTEYNGIKMRSKLEANWALFFDAIGIEWEYEKHRLPGWLVDFSIKMQTGEWLYCEVKPADLETTQRRQEYLRHEKREALLSEFGYEKAMKRADKNVSVAMLGLHPFYTARDAKQLCIGLFYGNPFNGEVDPIAPLFDSLALKYDNGNFGLSMCWGVWDDLVNPNVAAQDFIYRGDKIEKLVKTYFPFSNI